MDSGWCEEPLLPERPARRIERPRVDHRVAFTAILVVLPTGLPWRLVPQEIGCSGVTAWRRLLRAALGHNAGRLRVR
jgi:transposase